MQELQQLENGIKTLSVAIQPAFIMCGIGCLLACCFRCNDQTCVLLRVINVTLESSLAPAYDQRDRLESKSQQQAAD